MREAFIPPTGSSIDSSLEIGRLQWLPPQAFHPHLPPDELIGWCVGGMSIAWGSSTAASNEALARKRELRCDRARRSSERLGISKDSAASLPRKILSGTAKPRVTAGRGFAATRDREALPKARL